ncbi:MAG: hypothetical protein ETSY2_18875 [Candidatus Entotheonella gemina]|uniref:Uncharacterized protein n=1 Tax=Candidatus Entotheonella gemina TaxID=1429439 RepID=W4M712_9BACT|nr:MAG: hypothetical protein ETSY2_18875 [Candidatus Entotheonella gemina]
MSGKRVLSQVRLFERAFGIAKPLEPVKRGLKDRFVIVDLGAFAAHDTLGFWLLTA